MKSFLAYYKTLISDITYKKRTLFFSALSFCIAFLFTFYLISGVLIWLKEPRPFLAANHTYYRTQLADDILRLHVVANSDSDNDQEIKLKVKDHLISYIRTALPKTSSKKETIQMLSSHSKELKQEAEKILMENGFFYDANIVIGSALFPVKTYGDITLPAGNYDALRIILGKGEGKNWWCILFPSLCYVDETYQIVPEESKEELRHIMTEEEYESILTKEEPNLEVHFKLWDWLCELF